MNQDEFLNLVGKYLQKEATAEEVNMLESFKKHKEYKELFDWLEAHWQQIYQPENPGFDKTADLRKLSKRIQEQDSIPEFSSGKAVSLTKKQMIERWLPAAAIVALVIFAGVYSIVFQLTSTSQGLVWVEKLTAPGKRETFTLTDGSQVTLNANSRLRYPKTFSSSSRDVVLEGEAFFSIAKDLSRPFTVSAGKSKTTVLGTKFNVMAFPKDSILRVSLVEGKVEVVLEDQPAQRLKPKQQWVFRNLDQVVEIGAFDVQKVIGWKDNIFVFEGAPLEGVLDELGKHFGVTFHFDAEKISNCIVDIKIKNESLSRVLEVILGLSNTRFSIQGEDVYLVDEGCD